MLYDNIIRTIVCRQLNGIAAVEGPCRSAPGRR